MGKWIKNISYSLGGKIAAMFFLLLLDVSAARLLKVETYAEWVYFFSILTMLFYLGWFGINTSAKVFMSKCTTEKTRINCLFASVVLRFFFSIIIAVLVGVFIPQLARYLGYPEKYPDLRWLLGFSAVLVFLNSFTELFKEIFMGIGSFKSLFWVTVVEYFGYFVFSFIGLLLFDDIRAIAAGYLIAGVLVEVVGWTILYRQNKNRLKLIDHSFGDVIFPILKYALPIALISLGGLILIEMDTFMLGMFSTKENVATYSIAKNLCSKATHVNYALTVGVMTSFSVVTPENRVEKRKEFNKAMEMNVGITLLISIGFLLFANIAVRILYGELYLRAAVLLRLLVIYYALYGISNFFSSFLDFKNKAGIRSVFYMSVILINLVLNYIWIPRYGAIGAAVATDLSLVPYTIFVTVGAYREWKT